MIILFIIGASMALGAVSYLYFVGIKFVNDKFNSLTKRVLANIFLFITFIPFLPVYCLILSIDSIKKTKKIKSMAIDKNIDMDDFSEEFEKYSWMFNAKDRSLLQDKAFYVRNSK